MSETEKITIEIENSFSKILFPFRYGNYRKELQEIMKYEKPGSSYASYLRTGKYRASYVRLYNLRTGILPTGLVQSAVQFFIDSSLQFVIHDNRKKPKLESIFYRIFNPFYELRPYQDEALNNIKKYGRGIIELATGCGKSLVIYRTIKDFGLKTLIVVPSVVILKQMHVDLVYHFGEKKIGIISGGKKQINKDIIIGTPQSVIKYVDHLNDHVEMLIIDESHHASSNVLRNINQGLTNVYYRFYATATPFRNDGADLELTGIIGSKKLVEYDAVAGIRDKYLCPPLFVIYKFVHTGEEYKRWQTEQTKLLVENDKYNQTVADVAIHLEDKGRKTIVFVTEIEHGETLSKLIPGSIFVNGTKDRKWNHEILTKFAKGEIPTIIATTVVGEGANLVEADAAIIASGGKSKGAIMQKVGRIMRVSKNKEYAIVIDFTHENSKYLLRHAKQRIKIYKTYKTKIIIHDKEFTS